MSSMQRLCGTMVFAVLLTGTLVAGCGGGGEATGTAPPVDSTSADILDQALKELQAGDYTHALALAERVEVRQPGLTETNYVKGQIYYDLKMYDRAREFWGEVSEAEPDYWLWSHNLGDLAFRQERFQDAATHYREAVEDDPNPVSLHALASAYWEMGKLDSLQSALQRALQIDSTYAPAYLSLSNVAEEQGEIELALEYAEKAVALAPAETANQLAAGVLSYKAGRYEETLDHLRKVLERDPTNATALYNYGQALQRTGKPEEAEQFLEAAERAREQERALQLLREAVANNPTSVRNQMSLADALRRTGRTAEALRAYKAADVLAPGNLAIEHAIATLHLNQGDLEEAVRRYVAIISRDSTFVEAWLNLGLTFARMDSMEAAEDVWRAAAERFPDHPGVNQVMERIEG